MINLIAWVLVVVLAVVNWYVLSRWVVKRDD
jgi:hypothetical protein